MTASPSRTGSITRLSTSAALVELGGVGALPKIVDNGLARTREKEVRFTLRPVTGSVPAMGPLGTAQAFVILPSGGSSTASTT